MAEPPKTLADGIEAEAPGEASWGVGT